MNNKIKIVLIFSLLINIIFGSLLYLEYNNDDEKYIYDLLYKSIHASDIYYEYFAEVLEHNIEEKDSVSYSNLRELKYWLTLVEAILSELNVPLAKDYATKKATVDSFVENVLKTDKYVYEKELVETLKEDSKDVNELLNYLNKNKFLNVSTNKKKDLIENFEYN